VARDRAGGGTMSALPEPVIPLPMLQRLREGADFTRKDLAQAASCSIATIQHAETGRRRCGIQLGTAQGIARALGTTVHILQAESVVEALAEQRRATAKLLLGYRAVPYHGGRKKKKEAHCGV
jgi:transcriptional regulator with XRE-family HTH domain